MTSQNQGKRVHQFENDFFASCARGLEEVLSTELDQQGIEHSKITKGGIKFQASIEQALKLLVHTRVASRVYRKLFHFDVKVEDDFYFRGKEIPWDEIFDVDETFKLKLIQSSSPNGEKRSKFKNSLFLTYKVKDSIVDYFKDKKGKRPDIELKKPDISFLLHCEAHDNPHSSKERVELMVDLSGFPLFKRGYRYMEYSAPLKETLAAGLIKLTGWDGKLPFVDLMCGSGTFPIEAKLISNNCPPAFKKKKLRTWAFLHQKWTEQNPEVLKTWKSIELDITEDNSAKIWGNDISSMSLNTSEAHLEGTPYPNGIQFVKNDAFNFMPPCEEGGVVVMNPPYGERLGDLEDLKVFYKQLGDHLKQNWKGWRAFILIGDLELVKHVGLRTKRKHIIFNGPIECRWCEYELF